MCVILTMGLVDKGMQALSVTKEGGGGNGRAVRQVARPQVDPSTLYYPEPCVAGGIPILKVTDGTLWEGDLVT